jgi:predicted esterase
VGTAVPRGGDRAQRARDRRARGGARVVLILQGRNDTRTPARPGECYVERLRERGHPVEIDWFEAGHLGADDDLAIRQQALMIDFAKRVIGAG